MSNNNLNTLNNSKIKGWMRPTSSLFPMGLKLSNVLDGIPATLSPNVNFPALKYACFIQICKFYSQSAVNKHHYRDSPAPKAGGILTLKQKTNDQNLLLRTQQQSLHPNHVCSDKFELPYFEVGGKFRSINDFIKSA